MRTSFFLNRGIAGPKESLNHSQKRDLLKSVNFKGNPESAIRVPVIQSLKFQVNPELTHTQTMQPIRLQGWFYGLVLNELFSNQITNR